MDRARALRFAFLPAMLVTSFVLAFACNEDGPQDGEVFASALIGPEGGELIGGSVTLVIPPGALTAETEIELRRADASTLDGPGVRQTGGVVSMHPQGLILRQPASLSFAGERERAAVLFSQDGLTVAASGSTAYINELSLAAPASYEEDVPPRIVFNQPALGATPGDAGMTFRDTAHVELQVTDTPDVAVVLTIYDTQEAYDKPLNGTGDGECGFRLLDVVGGSLADACTEGYYTATVRATAGVIAFDIEPFLAGKMETPVTVGVVAGDDEIAYFGGFFSFDTGPCFGETCSGVGTCVVQGDGGACECQDGFVGQGLECVCQPDCSGRVCGPDGCGGSCAPGCGDNEICNGDGMCEPDGTPMDTGSSSDGSPMTSSSDGGMMTSSSSGGGMMTTSGGTTGGTT